MTASRLTDGGLIDRQTPLTFRWEGKSLQGFKGDTLASALLANGESIVARSFKYHRPRGVMSAGVEEAGAFGTIGEGGRTDPNVALTTVELHDGLVARGQNAWPNVRWDIGAVLGMFGRFFSAGFYYKTFMGIPPFESGRGTGVWMQYEKLIRRSAGMGTIARLPDPDRYEHGNLHCDVLVVGSGVAGASAAIAAAEAGLDVVLVEQDFSVGGELLSRGDVKGRSKLQSLRKSIEAAGVRVMLRTTAFGLYESGVVGLLEQFPYSSGMLPRQKLWTLRSQHVILATGAIERPLAFGNNDRPGVMSASAGRTYLNRYAVLPGRSVVVATNNGSGYQTAFDLSAAGASVTIIDSRPAGDRELSDIARGRNIDVQAGTAPLNVVGRRRVEAIEIAGRAGNAWAKKSTITANSLLVSGGWSPVVHLQSHRGGRPVWNDQHQCFLPQADVEGITIVGSAAGHWSYAGCEASGLAAGEGVVRKLKGELVRFDLPAASEPKTPVDPLFIIESTHPKKSFVDPINDVTIADVRLANQEGFISVEHLKRYTTLGMGNDQGKTGNVLGLAVMAAARGIDVPNVGTTRFRPPYTSISLGAIAGELTGTHFKPIRRTPMHDWHVSRGAKFIDAGLWHRTWYYPRNNETLADTYVREAGTVRAKVGMCDVTSLGKIAVQGPDSGAFLDRVYTNAMAKLAVGKTRYGIMLRDDGIVMDDGTCWRVSEDEFLVTTTTTNAGKVMTFLEELLQVRWPDLKVHVTSVTDQWAGFSLAGPLSRETLKACLADPDLLNTENCPFMAFLDAKLASGVPCRIARISFSGELAYEVYVPSNFGAHLAEVLSREVDARGGCQYGLEALGTLRIEKGHVTGAELDGRTTLEDAGLAGMASKKKPFIGSALRNRPELLKQDRARLVGIFPKDRKARFNAGSILCSPNKVSGFGAGWITAVTYSPALGHWIGLGYITGGKSEWVGKAAVAADPVRDGLTDVEIVSPHMFDAEGVRMNG